MEVLALQRFKYDFVEKLVYLLLIFESETIGLQLQKNIF